MGSDGFPPDLAALEADLLGTDGLLTIADPLHRLLLNSLVYPVNIQN